ncbi:MAG: preprotein translocase subunit YajC [Geminicoccaceae bacterium]
MFISPAYAQAAAPGGGGDIMMSLMPLVLVFAIFYFLLIRPQQTKMKQHREMLENLKKGDQVVTGGGIVGKVIRIEQSDSSLVVEIAPNVQVKIVRGTVADVLNKTVPASGNDNKAAPSAMAGGFLGKLLGKK